MASSSETNTATLKTYVNDMLGLQKHILEALEHQYADQNVKNDPEAIDLVGKLKSQLTKHVADLEGQVGRLGSEVTATVKQAVTPPRGTVAGLYDKVRMDPVSRMLRDDYTALNMASISLIQLHTTGLAYGDQAVADTALKHLNDITPMVMRINEIMPVIVVRELTDEGPGINTAVAATAVANTQAAWK